LPSTARSAGIAVDGTQATIIEGDARVLMVGLMGESVGAHEAMSVCRSLVRLAAAWHSSLDWLQHWRARRVASLLLPHVRAGDRVLDFGCGDLLIAAELMSIISPVKIVGLDVLDGKQPEGTLRVRYSGAHLPFADQSFDATYAAFVLHHTSNPAGLVNELLRVTRREVVLLEDVYESKLELQLLKAFDHSNLLFCPDMDLPLTFKTETDWVAIALAAGATHVDVARIRPAAPKPTRHRAFVLHAPVRERLI
jgi:SAM-dependent methyltransferase